mgnify:CR=1 FL=1
MDDEATCLVSEVPVEKADGAAPAHHPAFGMGMFHRLSQTMKALEHVRDSFRTGVGHDYDSHGPEGAVGIERSFEPWNRAFLVPVVLSSGSTRTTTRTASPSGALTSSTTAS